MRTTRTQWLKLAIGGLTVATALGLLAASTGPATPKSAPRQNPDAALWYRTHTLVYGPNDGTCVRTDLAGQSFLLTRLIDGTCPPLVVR